MTYLFSLAVLVFSWLYCFKTARYHALFFFYLYRSVGLVADPSRDGFVRGTTRVLHVFGTIAGLFAIILVIEALTN